LDHGTRAATAADHGPAGQPDRRSIRGQPHIVSVATRRSSIRQRPESEAIEIAYERLDWKPMEGGSITDALYEEYGLQSIRIPGACAHPTKLVQSAAMASVAPPQPSYRPHLLANTASSGLLSDAQLESVIYAGERIPAFSQDRGRSTRPGTLSLPHRMTPNTRCAFAAAGSSATAPAPARAGRPRASCSITG
jgi:hypothetical protein